MLRYKVTHFSILIGCLWGYWDDYLILTNAWSVLFLQYEHRAFSRAIKRNKLRHKCSEEVDNDTSHQPKVCFIFANRNCLRKWIRISLVVNTPQLLNNWKKFFKKSTMTQLQWIYVDLCNWNTIRGQNENKTF